MSTFTKSPIQFALPSRILHWLMAACLLAMLFIGVAMVASLGDYHTLLGIHRPLGILILLLTPIFWSVPTAFMVGELASAPPHEGGYYAWVRRGLVNFWGF